MKKLIFLPISIMKALYVSNYKYHVHLLDFNVHLLPYTGGFLA